MTSHQNLGPGYNIRAHCPQLQCLHTTSAILAGSHSYFVVSSFKCEGKNSCHDLTSNPRIYVRVYIISDLKCREKQRSMFLIRGENCFLFAYLLSLDESESFRHERSLENESVYTGLPVLQALLFTGDQPLSVELRILIIN